MTNYLTIFVSTLLGR